MDGLNDSSIKGDISKLLIRSSYRHFHSSENAPLVLRFDLQLIDISFLIFRSITNALAVEFYSKRFA